ncbi:hypothetical protein acsn021_45200 [Anaerocolumna cellulosilytica]|uniref:Uncharacterized protein n=1 Tax=Anaerocolumna cellulosilytica TaxID=433286 RepID=A0A6S6RDZ1_9FIRM|nr:GNAT family N-acetyltransferase [Anaerocolumna cellulosilytica]MBB5195940.1 putative GNAT family N-acyltransferase [Anaerocolumna cellulosilytica]BCJ96951.1 hypothetical protein acsn021_45200 [Anaerocolumna cellulosilytica]
MIKGKVLVYGDDLSEVILIRKQVFSQEAKYCKTTIMDNDDEFAVHAVVYDVNKYTKPIGTGRLIYKEGQYILDNIMVIKEERNKKYGDFVIRLLVNKAFSSGAKEIILDSPKDLVLLFQKIGFKMVNETSNYVEKRNIKMKLLPENVYKECNNN